MLVGFRRSFARPFLVALHGLAAALLLAGYAAAPPTAPTPTVGIPPEALSGMLTAVVLMSTQAAQIQATGLTIATPTAQEDAPSEADAEATAVSQAPPPPVPAPRPVAAASAADAVPCAVGQIKGNLNSMIYHVPGGGSYARTRANVVCYDSEAQAEAAGYRKARN